MVRCVVCGMRPPCRGLSFHSFPIKDKQLLEKWLAVVPRKNFQATYHTKICSRHFLESSYFKGYVNKKQLKNDAVPILNTDLNTCKIDEKLTKIENEVENTPLITSHDHAYCKGKASKRNNENKGKISRKNLKDNDENVLKKQKVTKSNQGILTDTSQYETIKFSDSIKVKITKLPNLVTLPDNIIDSSEEDFTSAFSNNDTANNNSNKVTNHNIMNKVTPTNVSPPHHNSDHIYNRSLSMIEKQESILKRKENSIKKLRKKLMNSERKSRRQALKIKELKELIVELMVKNKEKSCADCSVGNHFLCHGN